MKQKSTQLKNQLYSLNTPNNVRPVKNRLRKVICTFCACFISFFFFFFLYCWLISCTFYLFFCSSPFSPPPPPPPPGGAHCKRKIILYFHDLQLLSFFSSTWSSIDICLSRTAKPSTRAKRTQEKLSPPRPPLLPAAYQGAVCFHTLLPSFQWHLQCVYLTWVRLYCVCSQEVDIQETGHVYSVKKCGFSNWRKEKVKMEQYMAAFFFFGFFFFFLGRGKGWRVMNDYNKDRSCFHVREVTVLCEPVQYPTLEPCWLATLEASLEVWCWWSVLDSPYWTSVCVLVACLFGHRLTAGATDVCGFGFVCFLF